jgi:hypothetical protein
MRFVDHDIMQIMMSCVDQVQAQVQGTINDITGTGTINDVIHPGIDFYNPKI